MKAIEVMAREHAVIDEVLTRLEGQASDLEVSGELDVEVFERLLSFFEQSVDGHHQEKEERVFLPWLAARAEGEEAALVRTAAADHGAQRQMLALLRNNLEGAMYGEPNSLAVVARFTGCYARHQRAHSRWETEVLFALARRILTHEDDLAILRGFERMETVRGGSIVAAGKQLEDWLARRCTPLAR